MARVLRCMLVLAVLRAGPGQSQSIRTWVTGNDGTRLATDLYFPLVPGAEDALACTMPAVATTDFHSHAAFQGSALRQELLADRLDGQDALYFYDRLREHRLWDSRWKATAIVSHAAEARARPAHRRVVRHLHPGHS